MTTQAYARRTHRKTAVQETTTMHTDDANQGDGITDAEMAELRQLSPKNLRRILGVLRAMRDGRWGQVQQEVFEEYMTRGNRVGLLAMADHFAVKQGEGQAARPAYSPKVQLTGVDRTRTLCFDPLKKRCDSVAWAILEHFSARYWEATSYKDPRTGERLPMSGNVVWRDADPDPNQDLWMAMFDVVSWLLAEGDSKKRDFMLREWVGEKYLAEWKSEGEEQP